MPTVDPHELDELAGPMEPPLADLPLPLPAGEKIKTHSSIKYACKYTPALRGSSDITGEGSSDPMALTCLAMLNKGNCSLGELGD